MQCINGSLGYLTADNHTDRIPDFSSAGYGGGGVGFPDSYFVQEIYPDPSGNDTDNIQSTINFLADLPTDNNGMRGVVLLAPGIFTLTTSINITASGIILRGSGSDQTLLNLTSKPFLGVNSSESFIQVTGSTSKTYGGGSALVTDSFVPVHATSLNVSDASRFNIGDGVYINRTVTQAWINAVGMSNIGGSGVGWNVGDHSYTDRIITSISGNTLTFDAPLTDPLNASLSGQAGVTTYSWPGRLNNVGIESLSAFCPPGNASTNIQTGSWTFTYLLGAQNVWVSGVNVTNFDGSFARVDRTVKWTTMQDVNIVHGIQMNNSQGYPSDINISGSQGLYQRITGAGSDVFWLVTQSYTNGPNVIKDSQFTSPAGKWGYVAPHQRWATGLLAENNNFVNGGYQVNNRGTYGTNQGWSAAWTLSWNNVGTSFSVYSPPTATNWCVGCQGAPPVGNGTFWGTQANVWPQSLYNEQLKARLGPVTGGIQGLSVR